MGDDYYSSYGGDWGGNYGSMSGGGNSDYANYSGAGASGSWGDFYGSNDSGGYQDFGYGKGGNRMSTTESLGPRSSTGMMFGGGGGGRGGGGFDMSALNAAIASDNAARKEARERALADRAQAISGQEAATQKAIGSASQWKAGVDYLNQNPDVISQQVRDYVLGRVFDRVDLDTASSENLLAQRYAQSGRSINPAVMQFTRDKAMMTKANETRNLEIAATEANRASRERATAAAGEYGRYEGGLYGHQADAIGQYLANTRYDTPQTAQLLASLAGRFG